MKQQILSDESYAWPYAEGKIRGQAVEPLHPKVPVACLRDKTFYELISLADAIRVGKVREKKLAIELIRERI